VCPELLGGLDVPRPPAEIRGGDGLSVLRGLARVVNSEGIDVTGAYLDGARTALLIGLQAGCSSAILKEGSPACGAGAIHDGSFAHTRVAGDGVLAALLRQHGFNVRTEEVGLGLSPLGPRPPRRAYASLFPIHVRSLHIDCLRT
jgi:uncharacterized protein YbbK (DUF523 family)